MDQEKIGKLIKKIRIEGKYSQKEFAEKYGVTPQAVSKWENGKNIPDIAILKRLLRFANYDEDIKGYHIALPLIGQLGKNYYNNYNIIFYNCRYWCDFSET